MRVAELMQTDVRSIAPDATIAEVVQAMADLRVSGLPVVSDSGKVLGVVSATDVLQAEAEASDTRARARLFEHATAREIMTPSVDRSSRTPTRATPRGTCCTGRCGHSSSRSGSDSSG